MSQLKFSIRKEYDTFMIGTKICVLLSPELNDDYTTSHLRMS